MAYPKRIRYRYELKSEIWNKYEKGDSLWPIAQSSAEEVCKSLMRSQPLIFQTPQNYRDSSSGLAHFTHYPQPDAILSSFLNRL